MNDVNDVRDQLLAAMYRSFYADEARFDITLWLRKNDMGQSAFATSRDKLELDIGPNGRNLIDAMSNAGLIEKRVGSEAVILPAGIDRAEQENLVESDMVNQIRDRRFRLLSTIQTLQAQSSDQSRAQTGRVMNETRLNRFECAPVFKEFEKRGWTEAPSGQKEGWVCITWEGAQALDQMRSTRPPETDSAAPQAESGGATPLSAIKFFD